MTRCDLDKDPLRPHRPGVHAVRFDFKPTPPDTSLTAPRQTVLHLCTVCLLDADTVDAIRADAVNIRIGAW